MYFMLSTYFSRDPLSVFRNDEVDAGLKVQKKFYNLVLVQVVV